MLITRHFCHLKVDYFDLVINLIVKNVLRFQIAMPDSLVMHIIQGIKYKFNDFTGSIFIDWLIFMSYNVLSQIWKIVILTH